MVDDSETLNVLLGFSAPGGGNHLELKDVDGKSALGNDFVNSFEMRLYAHRSHRVF